MFLITPVFLILQFKFFRLSPQHCWDFATSSPLENQCDSIQLEQGSDTSSVECAQNGCYFPDDGYLKAPYPPNLTSTWTFALWIRDYGQQKSSVLSFVPNLVIIDLPTSFIKDTWFLFYSFSDGSNNEAGLGGYAPSLGFLHKTLSSPIDLSVYQTDYYLRIGSRAGNVQGTSLIRHLQIYIGSAFKSDIPLLLQSVSCPTLLKAPACTDYIFDYRLIGQHSKNPLVDSSSNALHITDYNATLTESGLHFSQGDYAVISPLSPSLLGFSFQFYLKLESSSLAHLLFAANNSAWNVVLYFLSSWNLALSLSGQSKSTPLNIATEEWNHYAFSFMRVSPTTTYISLYLNGALINGALYTTSISSFTSLTIGSDLTGTIQQFHMYHTPLADQTFYDYKTYMPLICDSQSYYDSLSNTCPLCPSLCATCTSSSSCTSCTANASSSSGLCQCDLGFFNNSGTCSSCSSHCETCSSSTSCSKCASTYYLLNNACVDTCPSGFHSNQASMKCEPCSDTNCAKCPTSPSICTECNSSTRYFLSSSGICQYCNPTYLLSHTACSTCSDSIGAAFDDNGECKDICGDSLIYNSECDDGNLDNGDGCNSECKIEPGYICESVCNPILPLTIQALQVSDDYILQIYLSHVITFQGMKSISLDFTIQSIQLSIAQNHLIFQPELLSSPLTGNYSQFKVNLNPQSSIAQNEILSLSIQTSSLSTTSQLVSLPVTIQSQANLPSYEFISAELNAAIQSVGNALDYATLFLVIGISVGQLLLQSSMEPLWSLINLNQLIFMLPLLSVNLSKVALIAFQILGIANGDMALLTLLYSLSLEPLISSSSSSAYNSRFQFLGYESQNLVQNSGIFLTIQFLLLFMVPVLYLARKLFKCNCFKKCATNAIRSVVCNGIIRALLQTFLEITICAIVNIIHPSFVTIGDCISYVLSLALLPIYLALPFKILRLLTSPSLNSPNYDSKYGEVYLSLNTSKSEPRKYFFVIFCFHRLIFIFLIFALSISGTIQLLVMIVVTILYTLYLLIYKPFKSGFDQCSNVFNLFFLTIFYGLCLIVHLVNDLREIGGFLILGSIGFINGANFAAIIGVKIWDCKKKSNEKGKKKELVIIRATMQQKEIEMMPNQNKVFKEMPVCLATKRWKVKSASSRKSLLGPITVQPQYQKTTVRQHWAYEASRAAKRKVLEERTVSFLE